MTHQREWATFFTDQLAEVPLIVILRGLSPHDAVATARQAWQAGVRLVEVTVEHDSGLAALEAVLRAAPNNAPVGAGTVTTPEQLATIADIGAGFGVAPGLDSDTVHAADEHGIPFLPGVATPSEAGHALRLGLTTIKAFPASTLGPEWVRALAGPFPQLRTIPTGGIREHTAADFLQAGALAVGLGTSATAEGIHELLRRLPAARAGATTL